MMEINFTNTLNVLNEYCEAFNKKYMDNLQRDDRLASRNLINSISTEIEFDGETITVVLNVADYYWFTENGRNAGKFPPIDKIIQWIKDKPIIPREDSNGRLPTEKQLAFLIGRKIANEGYEGKPSLSNSIDELNPMYEKRLELALRQDVMEYELRLLDEIASLIDF